MYQSDKEDQSSVHECPHGCLLVLFVVYTALTRVLTPSNPLGNDNRLDQTHVYKTHVTQQLLRYRTALLLHAQETPLKIHHNTKCDILDKHH